jgi:adenosylhomocysteine nucleosidase
MNSHAPIAILSALAQEQDGLRALLQDARCVQRAGREFWSGQLEGKPVVLALSRIGKVAAATTTSALIEGFGARRVVFTGVAGGVGEGVNVGDVVVGDAFVQHDMNAAPLFPRYEIPLYGRSVFDGHGELTSQLLRACQAALQPCPVPDYAAQVHQGLIASGDRFVNGAAESAALLQGMHEAGHRPLAVEMEGAAVAQVCADYGVPFAAVRTISDRADDSAHVDFVQFVNAVASVYARRIVVELLRSL